MMDNHLGFGPCELLIAGETIDAIDLTGNMLMIETTQSGDEWARFTPGMRTWSAKVTTALPVVLLNRQWVTLAVKFKGGITKTEESRVRLAEYRINHETPAAYYADLLLECQV